MQAHFVVECGSGHGIVAAAQPHYPHLVVLDWNLPGTRSRELLRQIREVEPQQRPGILVVSESRDEQQMISSFDLGVDDFVFKPYSPAELVARIRAILRGRLRKEAGTGNLRYHHLRVDTRSGRFLAREQPVSLRRREFRLLHFLLQHSERVFTREQLLTRLWGRDSQADTRAVDVTVQRTRKALMRHGCAGYLQTVRGFGYRLAAPAQ